MTDITLDKASLIALWVETLLYGGYAVLFAICVHVLIFRSKTGVSSGRILLVAAVVMFALSSMHVAVGLARAIDAFILSAQEPGGALGYYAQIWLWLNIFKQALYATNNILADALVIYRCFIVWGSNWKIIVFPVIMLIATTICGYAAVYNFSQVFPGQDVFATNIAEWGTALFSLSLATNIIVTSLIAGRIWWISRGTKGSAGQRYMQRYNKAVTIILESGAIYSASLVTLLVLYCLETNAQYVAYDALAQIMGIVPTLIIVRVGLGYTTQNNNVSANMSAGRSTLPQFTRSHAASGTPLQVRKVVQIDGDLGTYGGVTSSRLGDDDGYKAHY